MNKSKMVKEIIVPIMKEKGLCLKRHVMGVWEWEKEIDDVVEEVSVIDISGVISLKIGKHMHGVWHVSGESLLSTLESPRTKTSDWRYWGKIDAELYRNILLDFRDILDLNCDEVLRKHAKEIRSAIPNKRHFEKYVEHFDELAEEYREKLEISDENVLEIWDIIMDKIGMLIGKPIEEVEDLLLGYAALMEKEMLKQYGGDRDIDYDLESCILFGIGKWKSSFNFMGEMFWAWESELMMEMRKKDFQLWYEREEKQK